MSNFLLDICLFGLKMMGIAAVLFIFLGIIYTIIKNKKNKIGKDFDIFKKKPFIDFESEYLLTALKKIDGYKKVIKYNDAFLMFHIKGIYLLKPLSYTNRLLGNIKDEVLVNWLDAGNIVDIPNFFTEMDSLNTRLEEKIKEPITNIIIKKEICVLEVKYTKKFNVISKTNFIYKLNNFIKNENTKYSKDDIKVLMDKLK